MLNSKFQQYRGSVSKSFIPPQEGRLNRTPEHGESPHMWRIIARVHANTFVKRMAADPTAMEARDIPLPSV